MKNLLNLKKQASQFKQLPRINRIQVATSWFLQATVLIAAISAIIAQNWLLTFSAFAIFIVMFAPQFIEKKFTINLPVEFEFVITLFIYASLFLGEIHDFYNRVWWWDTMLHALSAIVFAFVGFLIVYILYNQRKLQTSAAFIALFSFCFAMAIGAVWEIFEFSMDQIFGLNMQRTETGVVDTMIDLIVDAIGALIVSVIGYFYVKGGDSLIFDRFLKRFLKENPNLLKQK